MLGWVILRSVPNHADRVDQVFKALADPTRRQVIERLVSGPASTSELAEPFAMALPSFTQHLAVLEGAGLVTSDKQGVPGPTGWRHPVSTRRKAGSPANAERGSSASTNSTSSSSTRRSHRDLHPAPCQHRPRPRAGPRRPRLSTGRVRGMDRPGLGQAVVRAPAVLDLALRDRPATRRRLPHRHERPRRQADDGRHQLLPRGHPERAPRVDNRAHRRLPAADR